MTIEYDGCVKCGGDRQPGGAISGSGGWCGKCAVDAGDIVQISIVGGRVPMLPDGTQAIVDNVVYTVKGEACPNRGGSTPTEVETCPSTIPATGWHQDALTWC